MIYFEDVLSDFENTHFPHPIVTSSESDVFKQSPEVTNLPRHSNAIGMYPIAVTEEFGSSSRQSILSMGAIPLAARSAQFENISIAEDVLDARASAIRHGMSMYEQDYLSLKSFTIFVGTWNVNGASPKESLWDWLSVYPVPPDLVAVGFQELDLRKRSYIFAETSKEQEWLAAVRDGLNVFAMYKMVKLARLVGIMMVVFIKEELAEYVTNVAAATVGTGFMGKLGNKGGVAIRLDFHQTSVCFVNCHLAAHMNGCSKRNQDYNNICARIIFNKFKPPKYIQCHDHIYWMGDMNYRVDHPHIEQVKDLIEKESYSVLIEHDQLAMQIRLKNVFVDFHEGLISFPPTYKYDTGTNNWHSETHNPPAWCDRILWKGENISQFHYRSHPTLLHSDHKPVSAFFECQVQVCDEVKRRKILKEVTNTLDRLENDILPHVEVDRKEVNFDKVQFMEPKIQTITVTNNGPVLAHFEFKKMVDDIRYCKDWLRIKPWEVFMMPGETCDVNLEVLVDKRIARKFNAGKEIIYDVLILHLEGGGDIFIIISGTYVPSCFGTSLEALVRIPGQITQVPSEDLAVLENAILNQSYLRPQHFEIPKEICIMVNHLYRFGFSEEGLFLNPDFCNQFHQIREKLDNRINDLEPCSVHSVAQSLLTFLEALAEPVIPYEFYYNALNASYNFAKSRNVVDKIQTVHRRVFRYLVCFLRDVLCHSSANKLDANKIAAIFGGILLREPGRGGGQTPSKKKQKHAAAFLLHFFVNDLDHF